MSFLHGILLFAAGYVAGAGGVLGAVWFGVTIAARREAAGRPKVWIVRKPGEEV